MIMIVTYRNAVNNDMFNSQFKGSNFVSWVSKGIVFT